MRLHYVNKGLPCLMPVDHSEVFIEVNIMPFQKHVGHDCHMPWHVTKLLIYPNQSQFNYNAEQLKENLKTKLYNFKYKLQILVVAAHKGTQKPKRDCIFCLLQLMGY